MIRFTVGPPLRITALASLFSATLTAAMPSQQSKPRVEHRSTVELRGAVATLDELVSLSDLIVEGRIVGQRPHDFDNFIYTIFDFQVSRTYKRSAKVSPDVATGSRIQLRRRGGIRERADRIDVHEPSNFALYAVGDNLLLFLRAYQALPPQPSIGTYFVETTYGPDSVFQLGNGNALQARGSSQLSRQLGGLGAAALRARLPVQGGQQ